MSNKKDASTSTISRASAEDTDDETYFTAQGSAQNIEEITPLPWRSTKGPAATPQTPTADKAPTETPTPTPPTAQTPQRPAERAQPSSVFSSKSAVSYNPSVFGEGPTPNFDDELRRGTIAWPQNGCIYIPLRPPGALSNETLTTEIEDENLNRDDKW